MIPGPWYLASDGTLRTLQDAFTDRTDTVTECSSALAMTTVDAAIAFILPVGIP